MPVPFHLRCLLFLQGECMRLSLPMLGLSIFGRFIHLLFLMNSLFFAKIFPVIQFLIESLPLQRPVESVMLMLVNAMFVVILISYVYIYPSTTLVFLVVSKGSVGSVFHPSYLKSPMPIQLEDEFRLDIYSGWG